MQNLYKDEELELYNFEIYSLIFLGKVLLKNIHNIHFSTEVFFVEKHFCGVLNTSFMIQGSLIIVKLCYPFLMLSILGKIFNR